MDDPYNPPMAKSLLLQLRNRLKSQADPVKAPQMQRYMKSTMPYHGVQTPLRRSICREIFKDLDFSTDRLWRDHVLALWNGAEFREERYAALDLAAHRKAKGFQVIPALTMYEQMIVTGAWWDYVDEIAHRLEEILRHDPEKMKKKMRVWSTSSNMWKRRSSIICQLDFKRETDLHLLYSCIEPSLSSKEFFLQKAIGWALRQYAWTDAKEVTKYVRLNHDRLSPLSQREALKNLKKIDK